MPRSVRGQESFTMYHHGDLLYGADEFIQDTSSWKGRKIALVVNQTSILHNNRHLVDELLDRGADIRWIYAPEHGFRGSSDAGEHISDARDKPTGIEIKSLYGSNKKPDPEDLKELDLVVFDIQDVGTRFYTYLSTLYYVMQSAAEARVPLVVLDRPNPNAYYVDGPVLDTNYKSFVGMIEVPIVHGMTLGELAGLIKGEKWIENAEQLDLSVYKCKDYHHNSTYQLPINPSPNLPNLRSILLYPSLCYFEACRVSVGRGTDKQFQLIGGPALKEHFDFYFIPQPKTGATDPKFQDQKCYGIDLSSRGLQNIIEEAAINWSYLFQLQDYFPDADMVDRERFMNLLVGNHEWKKYLLSGDIEGWRESYQPSLRKFKDIRARYLLYPDH